ncbi:MAG: hypothetical protein JNL97_00960, partial [Verrucomicrobiales bacterium]|nr:hypothetical protein [Verrucomicrobiales bacterium]
MNTAARASARRSTPAGRLSEIVLMAAIAAWIGCESASTRSGSREAKYPKVENAVGPGAGEVATPTLDAAAILRRPTSNPPPLWGLQSELTPATLWYAAEGQVSVFAGLEKSGLGAPTFVAYSSPTGIAVLRPGNMMSGDQMRENWLLAGFPGAAGWESWDSPWGVFLQKRPARVGLGTNELRLEFEGAAGFWTLLPLYGAYRPPQQGKEVLGSLGFKEKSPKTWEWPLVVARDPLTRLRYWAGATRRFPVRERGTVSVDGRRGTVTLEERFDWLQIDDEWSTRPILLAPVSPALGLAIGKSSAFPVEFSKAPFDFEFPTVYGPWFAVPDANTYSVTIPVLRFVAETERLRAPDAPPTEEEGKQILEELRAAGRALFGSPASYRPEGAGDWASEEALIGYAWQARALDFFEPAVRSNAVATLRRAMWDHVLEPSRFVEPSPARAGERSPSEVEGSAARDASWTSVLLQSVWAVADAIGDRSLVRERWPLLARQAARSRPARWVALARGTGESVGEGAAGAIAYARLAWLAGDLEAYRLGCGEAAKELTLLHARLRGVPWFREQQPWQPGPPIPETARVGPLLEGTRGWEIVGGTETSRSKTDGLDREWSRFFDPDVARFCRTHAAPELRRAWNTLGTTASSTGAEGPARVVFRSFGFVTNTTARSAPVARSGGEAGAKVDAGTLALSMARARRRGWVGIERLVPDVALTGPAAPLERPAQWPHLVVSVARGDDGSPAWPRLGLVDWPTPTGSSWNL